MKEFPLRSFLLLSIRLATLQYIWSKRKRSACRQSSALGSILCPKIQEDVIFCRYMDQRASAENMEAFIREDGFCKCALPAGVGARTVTEIITESMEAEQT